MGGKGKGVRMRLDGSWLIRFSTVNETDMILNVLQTDHVFTLYIP